MPEVPPAPLRLTRAQVREVDRRSIEDYHIPGIVLMENAARALTDVAIRMLGGVASPAAFIVCGGGNNGGDGLALARHLRNRGVDVALGVATDPATYRGDAAINWSIAEAMKLPRVPLCEADAALAAGRFHLLVDALFGTGLQSPPRDVRWIDLANRHPVPVLSVDLPSGLDCDTGEPLGPACVRATHTVTFVAEKFGFTNPRGRPYLGQVTVGDIGCPRELVATIAAGPVPPT